MDKELDERGAENPLRIDIYIHHIHYCKREYKQTSIFMAFFVFTTAILCVQWVNPFLGN